MHRTLNDIHACKYISMWYAHVFMDVRKRKLLLVPVCASGIVIVHACARGSAGKLCQQLTNASLDFIMGGVEQ